jgi:hypothetical protein
MAYGIRPRSFAIAFWRALAGAIVVLLVLAILNQRLSTGWRLYVLARALRAVWAATLAMIVGIGAGLLLDAAVPARRGRFSKRRMLFAALRSIIVLVTALGTLGYFMPDWTPLAALFAALTLSIWLAAGVTALTVDR